MHSDPVVAKAACRRDALLMRESLSPEARERKSLRIWENFLKLPELGSASTVLLYADHTTEVATRGLLARMLSDGFRVALPVVMSESPSLLLREASSEENLVTGAFGISVPPESAPEVLHEEVDLVVLPGVAFDSQCWRVGYGGGFYDRLLANSSPFSVGFCFECQILYTIPVECHDEQLDALVTEERIIRAPDH